MAARSFVFAAALIRVSSGKKVEQVQVYAATRQISSSDEFIRQGLKWPLDHIPAWASNGLGYENENTEYFKKQHLEKM